MGKIETKEEEELRGIQGGRQTDRNCHQCNGRTEQVSVTGNREGTPALTDA